MRSASRFIAVAGVLLTACRESPLSISATGNSSLSVSLGNELNITLQNIGPGEFQSPPEVSSPAVRFLDVSDVGFPPAGPTQRFRFKAVARGQAIISFHHTGNMATVEDTVVVR
jgi:hypothetical protein